MVAESPRFSYAESLLFDRDAIPPGIDEASRYVEDGLQAETDLIEAGTPDMTAPLSERLAHALAAARVAAEAAVLADFVEEVHRPGGEWHY
jgi:hypothetical protein